jgi:hypothetical protein
MHVTRRDLAVAGALALGTSTLLRNNAAYTEASDEAAVKQNVEALRKALLDADKARLEQLTADQSSYGHSDGNKIGALQIWQKQDGNWKLLARQGYKLA